MNAAPATLTKQDIIDFANTGGNLLRLSMPAMPFIIPVEPDYSGKRYFDSSAFQKMDQVINWCEESGVKVVIDPHTFPGQNMRWSMLGHDKIWTDLSYHEYIITIWKTIAKRYAKRGSIIAGYDLLNEPIYHQKFTRQGANDLNNLYKKLIVAIRKIDKHHTIIVAAPYYWDKEKKKSISYTIGIKYLDYISFDDNIVYEVHFYDPDSITNGALDKAQTKPYPGFIEGEKWDKRMIAAYFKNTIEFQKKNNATIYLGEFSCPRWLEKFGVNIWIKDVIEVCEENNISWTYHAWREASCWDAEKSNTDMSDDKRYKTTPRLEILKGYFKLNNSNNKK